MTIKPILDRIDGKNAMELLASWSGVIQTGHIELASGKHTTTFIDFDIVREQNTELFGRLCHELACRILEDNQNIQCVIGPATGGNPIAEMVANFLNVLSPSRSLIISVPTKKASNGTPIIVDRWEREIRNKNVFFVDDALSEGSTYRHFMEWRKRMLLPIFIMGIGVFCNRGGMTGEQLGVPILHSIVEKPIESWYPERCPLCWDGKVPLKKHRHFE